MVRRYGNIASLPDKTFRPRENLALTRFVEAIADDGILMGM